MFSFLRRGVDPRQELQKTLGSLELPSFSGIVMKVLETLRDPDSSGADVAAVLSTDPGLSVRLLRLVNSASHGGSRKVDSVSRAVSVAGMASVESLVLSIGVASALPRTPVEGFDPNRFWLAAARRAAVAQAFASELHPADASVSFTAGLLQDMAIPLLASARADYRPLLGAWHGGEGDLASMERSEFGWDHSEVATWLCDDWQLPELLGEAIGGHHGSMEGLRAPAAVTLVSALRETHERDGLDELIATARTDYGLSEDRSVELVEQAEEQAADIARLFQ